MSSHAALISVLGGQAYYDDQLDITWAQDANINGVKDWDTANAWAAGLTIAGVGGWRLPSMDVNGDDVIVDCTSDQEACKDNEYGHLNNYGAGTVFGSGITSSSPGPFSHVQSVRYWSSTGFAPNPSLAWGFGFGGGGPGLDNKLDDFYGWAVQSGNVGAVPVPAAVWLFGSGLIGLLGLARRKR
jgi:hypothetical protein